MVTCGQTFWNSGPRAAFFMENSSCHQEVKAAKNCQTSKFDPERGYKNFRRLTKPLFFFKDFVILCKI